MNSQRVLLVEDDPSLQRFVALVLEELPIELQCCSTVDEAIALLAAQPVGLLITDLMLPGRSGFDLLRALRDTPALRGQARLVVFSAGLTPQARARLDAKDVWRVLEKPCSVQELAACVREAVLTGESPPAAAQPPEAVASVAVRHFGGNEALYLAFRARCLAQFVKDVEAGDLACEHEDARALQRLAHSLKSVLLTLGHEGESDCARRLEAVAEEADWPAMRIEWLQLKQSMRRLA